MTTYYGGGIPATIQMVTDYDHIVQDIDQLGDIFLVDKSQSMVKEPETDAYFGSRGSPHIPNIYYGGIETSFENDWYDKIHIIPPQIDFGNIAGNVTEFIIIWNAYRKYNQLDDIVYTGDQNIEVDSVLPNVFTALQNKEIAVNATTEGPPIAQGTILFDFLYGSTYIDFIGLRATPFNYQPVNFVKESLKWSTDIITSFNGGEQRIRTRSGGPVQSITYQYHVRDFDRYRAHFMILSQFPYYWGIPIWWEGTFFRNTLPSGSDNILIDTTKSDFREGASVFIFSDPNNYEVNEVYSMTDTQIFFKRNTSKTYTDYYVLPMRTGPTQKSISRDVFANPSKFNVFEMSFTCNDNINLEGDINYPVYRDLYILTDEPIRDTSIKESYVNDFNYMETSTGIVTPVKKWNTSKIVRPYKWRIPTKDLWHFRLFLHYCAGQWKPFFLKTFENTVEVLTQILPDATQININRIQYFEYGLRSIYKYIHIELLDGTKFHKKIIGATLSGDELSEYLTVEEHFENSTNIDPSDIKRVYFMCVARFATDTIELLHHASGQTEIEIPIMGIDYDA